MISVINVNDDDVFCFRVEKNQVIFQFPSPASTGSISNTPVLSSLSSIVPKPLMSIGEKDFLFTITI